MINIAAFKTLRDAVAAESVNDYPTHFDMSLYYVAGSCGAAACLYGFQWSILELGLASPALDLDDTERDLITQSRVTQSLGLTMEQGRDLFLGRWSPAGLKATKDEALAYLDEIIATGELRDA